MTGSANAHQSLLLCDSHLYARHYTGDYGPVLHIIADCGREGEIAGCHTIIVPTCLGRARNGVHSGLTS